MNCRGIFLIFLSVLVTCCTGIQTELKIQKLLSRASYLVESNPDSSLSILLGIDTLEARKTQPLWMEYRLCHANALNRMDQQMPSSQAFSEVAAYYESHGDPAERMLAQYLMGRIYNVEHESPMAMLCFQKVLLINEGTKTQDGYRTLYRTHAQMADVYHNERAYDKALEELENAAQVALQAGDTAMYRYLDMMKMKPLELLGRFDEVIERSEEYRRYYLSLGDTSEAALIHQDALRAYLEKGRMADARAAMEDFEQNSGLFDADGRIRSGREVYYYTKGCYYLKQNDWPNAERQFRRLQAEQTELNSVEAACRGLLMLYSDRGINDSVGKYALLYGAVHDTLCKQQTAREVAVIQGMYDYSRHQALAESKADEARDVKWWLASVLALATIIVLLLMQVIHIKVKQHQKEQEYLKSIQEENGQEMKRSLKEREEEIRKYQRQIQNMEQERQREDDERGYKEMLLSNVEGPILEKLHLCGDFRTSKDYPISESDWSCLYAYTEVKYPILQKLMEQKRIAGDNLKLATLYILDLSEDEIREILDLSSSALSNRKMRLNERLFKDKSATTLRKNIMRQKE